ncbi:MAG: type II CRISPR RNA-guided endonuclease Cas9, partial [Neisseriaceae bacterium]|nr:type II CRISPR RNA-guided endonuclease Cas9 [Neisseriaceae bacterium]
TITQARKIINAIIAQYGQPFRVHIEMGRDLGKSRDERNKIEKRNKDNQAERERASNDFEELFGFKPKGKDILLKRLYDNQHGKCLYSGKPIDLERIFEKGYVEIDHAIPFSRSWDDSQNNKVLVLGAENQNKGNKTPFEWFGDDEQHWREFEARVNSCRFSLRKKQNILRRELEEGFIERNINDTRYATRFLKNYLENHLAFSGSLKYTDKQGTEHNYKKVVAPQGQITSLLRNSWGFAKVREDNDRHHALDAVIVACATESMQQKITAYKKWFEIKRRKKDHWDKDEWDEFDKLLQRKQEKVDTETGEVKYLFPVPWGFPEWFNTEINLRVFNQVPKRDENGKMLRDENNKIQYELLNNPYQKEELLDALAKHLPNCPQVIHDNVTPLFVSRMTSKDRFGRVHKDGLDKEKEVLNKDSKFQVRGGYSEYDSPVRIDIFKDDKGNNYFVPIYVNLAAQKLTAAELPKPQKKDRKGNIIPTEFYFSLYPYDLVEIEDDGVKEFAYYLWIKANGQARFKTPDATFHRKGTGKTDEKGKFLKSILGLKLKKYKVDILGKHLIEIEKEERQGFDAIFDDE